MGYINLLNNDNDNKRSHTGILQWMLILLYFITFDFVQKKKQICWVLVLHLLIFNFSYVKRSHILQWMFALLYFVKFDCVQKNVRTNLLYLVLFDSTLVWKLRGRKKWLLIMFNTLAFMRYVYSFNIFIISKNYFFMN